MKRMITPELTALALAGLLQALQLTPFATPANLELGPHFTTSPRDTAPPRLLSKVTARLQRATNNCLERSFPYFVASLHHGSAGPLFAQENRPAQ